MNTTTIIKSREIITVTRLKLIKRPNLFFSRKSGIRKLLKYHEVTSAIGTRNEIKYKALIKLADLFP